MTAVLKHELRNYFHSFTAYVFGAFLLAIAGIGSMLYNLQAAVSNFEYVLSFGSIVFVVIVPILTMRVIAEERKQKTDQLLYSLPITTTQVIAGKYLALLVVYLIPLAIISIYPLIFTQFGEVYLPTSYGSLFAIFMMGAALMALGVVHLLPDRQPGPGRRHRHRGHPVQLLQRQPVRVRVLHRLRLGGGPGRPHPGPGRLIRYLTKNELLAYGVSLVLAVAVCVTCFVDASLFEGLLPAIMKQLSLFERFSAFVNGVFDMTAIVYYLSVIGFFLFLSVQSLEKRRYN